MIRNGLKYLLLFTCLNLIAIVCLAQTGKYKFQHINYKQGLTANYVSSIVKDSHGFVWFGTAKGLYRYDGYEMKHYRHDPADTCTLSDDFILDICED